MSVIWNFSLQVKPEGEMIMAPSEATFVRDSIVVKGDVPHISAVVDPERDLVPYFFHTICAGQKFTVEQRYPDERWEEIPWDMGIAPVGTFMIGDSFIGHVFVQAINKTIRVKVDERYEDDFKEVGER
jgi:hypothetical protein